MTVEIEFHQHDWIPGFAAFLNDGQRMHKNTNSRAFCVLNLGSILAMVETKDMAATEVPYFIAESMMHEVIHAIEKWAGVEFSEERVEDLLEKYRVHAMAQPDEEP